MIYIIGWLLVYYYFAMCFFLKRHLKVIAGGVILLLSLIAIFRGSVGTDTATYERLVTRIDTWSGLEPAFWILMYVFNLWLDDPVWVVRAFSGIFAGILLWFVYKSDEEELFFLMAFFVPLFFYNYSMNVIRVGIAFSILLLALQQDRRQEYKKAILLGVLSVLFHYSLLFALFFLWFNLDYNKENVWNRKNLFLIFAVSSLIAILVILNEHYFLSKLAIYAYLEAPSLFSGLSRIMLGLVLLAPIPFSNISEYQKKRIIYSSLFFMILFFSMGIYVTPRLLDMVNLLIPMAMLRAYRRVNEPMDWRFKAALFVAGLGGAVGMYRYMLNESFWSPSPFLPYHTVFDR